MSDNRRLWMINSLGAFGRWGDAEFADWLRMKGDQIAQGIGRMK